ncbi:helix-turn-helix domain-containing protein [Aminobacter ciceronei]
MRKTEGDARLAIGGEGGYPTAGASSWGSAPPSISPRNGQALQREKLLREAIGSEVRARRRNFGMTATRLAAASAISTGMLSKIENGSISPSLGTLRALASALATPLTSLFRNFNERRDAMLVKAGRGVNVERPGTGYQLNLLGCIDSSSCGVMIEPYLVTITNETEPRPIFKCKGKQFIYMLEGEIIYRHSDNLYRLLPGDSLFFDTDTPHGPDELTVLPIRYLSITACERGAEER